MRPSIGPFIGREMFVARLKEAIADARLVTILGPPGIGKTRTAERVLELYGSSFEGGAHFCDLTQARDRRGLARAVAALFQRLDVASLADADVEPLVAESLASAGRTLLVLDNFEQIVSAAGAVRAWCLAAPSLTVLVTSRERLAVEGEVVLELLPLDVPRETDTPDRVLACEAVRMLSARATSIGGNLGADPRALGALVRQLDGVPLAIELAAARTRVLSPDELVARLSARSDLLARAPRQEGDRHTTLATAIEWSWNLLSEEEQRALAESSVFAGSFTLAAAEAVISKSGASEIVDVVGALRDKSLVYARGDGRFALYVSIREYAAKRLSARGPDAEASARRRHAYHYASALRAFNEARTFQDALPDAELKARLLVERENIFDALLYLSRAADTSTPPLLDDLRAMAELAIALPLGNVAPTETCLDALGATLRGLDENAKTANTDQADLIEALRPRIRLARHALYLTMGYFEESNRDLRELLELPSLPRGLRAFVLVMQGIQLRYQSRYREAWVSHEKCLEELRTLDLPRLRAMCCACMGRLQIDFDNEEKARAWNEEARAQAAALGDRWLEGLSLANVAQLEQALGRYEAAENLLAQAVTRFRETSEPHYNAVYGAAFGDLYFEWGKIEEARTSYEGAMHFMSALTAHRVTALLYASWGALEAMHGERGVAASLFERAHRVARRGESRTVSLSLELHEAHLRLRDARDSGDPMARTREEERCRETLRALRDVDDARRDAMRESFDARFAMRILSRAVEASREPIAPKITRLTIATNGTWFSIDDRAKVDIARRGSLRRIVIALADHQENARDAALDQDTLAARGWPGERARADAVSTRLRVAIATLRRLGLRDVLLTRDSGYLFDPNVRIERA